MKTRNETKTVLELEKKPLEMPTVTGFLTTWASSGQSAYCHYARLAL